ncbi:MAG: ribonuclease III [Clostridiales bacterium]|nr:ribonuclease III [Clostridiales bacterium]
MNQDLAVLENILGYAFADRALLTQALTHSSYAAEHGKPDNERMEFLGDAVLELAVSECLYRDTAKMREGAMTKTRAALVCEPALVRAAGRLNLPDFLLLGYGEDRAGGRDKPSIVSDALEAVIGAIYLDGGLRPAKEFVETFIITSLQLTEAEGAFSDYKTKLQELIAKRSPAAKIEYLLLKADGPEHKRIFTMGVDVNGKRLGEGEGASKQSAGQAAAGQALETLAARGGEVCD